jgi:hypothetical protein
MYGMYVGDVMSKLAKNLQDELGLNGEGDRVKTAYRGQLGRP